MINSQWKKALAALVMSVLPVQSLSAKDSATSEKQKDYVACMNLQKIVDPVVGDPAYQAIWAGLPRADQDLLQNEPLRVKDIVDGFITVVPESEFTSFWGASIFANGEIHVGFGASQSEAYIRISRGKAFKVEPIHEGNQPASLQWYTNPTLPDGYAEVEIPQSRFVQSLAKALKTCQP